MLNNKIILEKLSGLKDYFSLSDDLLPQSQAEDEIRAGVSFRGSQLLILIFAIFVASLGLNVDSIPVIIGAMLISPLMGPIIGMGLAIGIQDYELLRRSLKNIGMAVLGSLIASSLYFLISPQYEGSSQLLARTSPSIYDVLIAFFGGAAGIVSIACRNKGQVMPGVAIATSLMPPLCTAGYGIATLQPQFFFGAIYLFLTNMIFIFVASWIGVKVIGYKKVVYQNKKRAARIRGVVYSVITLMLCLSAYLTYGMIRKSIFLNKAAEFVSREMVFPNTQVLNHKEYEKDEKGYIDVTLIGTALPKDSLQLAMIKKLDSIGLGGTVLNIRQGVALGHAEVNEGSNVNQVYSLLQSEIFRKQSVIDSLRDVIKINSGFSSQASVIFPEVKVLFPKIKELALSRMRIATLSDSTTASSDTLNVVFVNAPGGLATDQREKLAEYIKVRLGQNNVKVLVNVAGFPWTD